jgi:ribosomal protein L2
LKTVSNASRKIHKWSSRWFDKKTSKRLSFRKLSLGGCSRFGNKIIRTRGRIISPIRLPIVGYNFRLTHPLIISTFKVVPFSNKILTLAVFPTGGLAYLPALDTQKIFDITFFRTYFLSYMPSACMKNLKSKTCMTLIATVRQYRRISNFELWPGKGIQYARSAWSWGKVTNRNLQNSTSVVYLPSGVRKIISIYSLIVPGRSAGLDKRLIKNTKSGYWRSQGFKSIVRGVAMNPVDHPHGGRTKAIKYPRTPWGTTTKFK